MVAEMVIGHGRKGLQRVYDQHRYVEEMREAIRIALHDGIASASGDRRRESQWTGWRPVLTERQSAGRLGISLSQVASHDERYGPPSE